MDKSRIIRSIVAVIFNLINILLIILCLKNINITHKTLPLYVKGIYIVICVISILLYSYVKKKIIQKISCQKIIQIYRYGFLATIIFLSRMITNYLIYLTVDIKIALGMLIALLNAVIIKKIIFNISTSDMISTITSIIYILLPQALFHREKINNIDFTLSFFLIAIYLILIIIDEVSQKSKKNNTYIIFTIIFCLFATINIYLGSSPLLWIILFFVILFTSKDIDYTNIAFIQRLFLQTKNLKTKKMLTKLEKTNINKLVIVLIIVTISTILTDISIKIYLGQKIFAAIYFSEILTRLNNILKSARNYYLILLLITTCCEFIGVILKRSIDLKSTIIKSIFILIIFSLFKSTCQIYILHIFDILVIFNCMLSISNIYFNREEKVKLLKDKN